MYFIKITRTSDSVKFTCNGTIAETVIEDGQLHLIAPCVHAKRKVENLDDAVERGIDMVKNILKTCGVFITYFYNAEKGLPESERLRLLEEERKFLSKIANQKGQHLSGE